MSSDFLSVRSYIFNRLNTFPWASQRQAETVKNYIDQLVAGRASGRQALLRSGMTSFTDRIIQYQLKQARYYVEQFFHQSNHQISKIDRRKVYHLAFDDTIEERVGKKVFAAAYQYNHSQSSVVWGQTLVDRVLISDHLMNVAFQTYLPKNYLERADQSLTEFQTKIQMVKAMFRADVVRLRAQGLAAEKIWATLDSWFACRELTTEFRQTGVNFLQGLKKNAQSHWFGQKARLDEIFQPPAPWRWITDPQTGKKVYYQEKILNLTCHGRCKVLAIRRGKERRIRYYATNRLKMSMQRLLPRLKAHWRVETLHRDLKQYFDLRGCYSGNQTLNEIHWLTCYSTYLLFCQYQTQKQHQGIKITIPKLIHWYQYAYDYERARKCFFSPKARVKLKKRIQGGKC
ncbi:MAG: transposase [Candidatus Hodarchaeota archaeon]